MTVFEYLSSGYESFLGGSISWVFLIFRVVTSLLYAKPCVMLRRMAHAVCLCISRFAKKLGRCFLCQTSTTKRAFANVGSSSRSGVSTVADTPPERIACSWRRGDSLDHQQPSKSLSFKVKSHFRHPSYSVCCLTLTGLWGRSMEECRG